VDTVDPIGEKTRGEFDGTTLKAIVPSAIPKSESYAISFEHVCAGTALKKAKVFPMSFVFTLPTVLGTS
jgi:hypothetical protein